MQYGIDKDGIRTHIEEIDDRKNYYCPCCKTVLVPKRGEINVWHFAHKSLANCVSYYDNKGEWHREMQDLFPKENREIYNTEFGNHFFDVLTNKGTIVEFQHSSISSSEFDQRSLDYWDHSCAHDTNKPIWVFDFVDRFFSVKYSNGNFRTFRWFRPSKIFPDGYSDEFMYDLWFRVCDTPVDYDVNAYGYTVPIALKQYASEPAYLCVSKISYDCTIVSGLLHSEEWFKKNVVNF